MTSPYAEQDIEQLPKWSRVTGSDRESLASRCKEMYCGPQQMSVRNIAQVTGRSYGAIHKLLKEAGVSFRPRGNPSR